MSDVVVLGPKVQKRLRRLPRYVVAKLLAWVDSVECEGLEETRRVPGFHDEPLRGRYRGRRSIRLSRGWRAIYAVRATDLGRLVEIVEVHHHDY